MTRMLGSDAVLRALEHEGVRVAFGIPGGAILPTYDAISRGTSVRHVLARHEQGAGHMAEGYARASGEVGVAIATSGPGATNLVTPIADAWLAEEGPGLFMPRSPAPEDLAGFGVVDPTAMLLTLSLLLAEGLHRRSAAHTLERAVAVAEPSGVGTRSVTDAVLELLPEVRTDVEMFEEIWAA